MQTQSRDELFLDVNVNVMTGLSDMISRIPDRPNI